MLVSLWMPGCFCIRVSMVLLSDVVYYIILLDAIGACLVVIWMIVWFLSLRMNNVCAFACLSMNNDGRYEPQHWTMWVAQEDRENMAMRLVVALLEFILGIVRAFAVVYWNSAEMLWLLAATYAVLGVFFLGLVLYRRVTGWFWLVSLDGFISAVLAALVAMGK